MINNIDDLRTALAAGDKIVVARWANLRKADLSKADLRGANLTRANLTDANLTDANLTDANLFGANLTGANLRCANLTDADLIGADLARANLTGANLRCANLTDANLRGADLTRANLRGANLTGADLRFLSAGNCREIYTIQSSRYKITYTSDLMAIGCKQYSIAEWEDFGYDTIAAMDTGALEWWSVHKPLILKWIAANPAMPHGGIKDG